MAVSKNTTAKAGAKKKAPVSAKSADGKVAVRALISMHTSEVSIYPGEIVKVDPAVAQSWITGNRAVAVSAAELRETR